MSNRRTRRAAASEARRRQDWAWVELSPDPALLAKYPAIRNVRAVYRNDFWIVQLFVFPAPPIGHMVHLMVRAVDGRVNGHQEPSWSELQRIKDELVSPECEAVQVYPRQRDIVDQADVYHLFVLPADWPLPFGLHAVSGFAKPESA